MTIVVDRLDLVDRHRLAVALEAEQPAQGHQPLRLVVDRLRVLLEDVVATGAGGVLQLVHRLGVEQVGLTLAPPLVLAAELELAVGTVLGARRVRHLVPCRHLRGDLVEADAAELGDRAGEVLVDELLAEADRFEDLRPGVRRHGRHAHLRHHLDDALAAGLDVVPDRLLRVETTEVVHPVGRSGPRSTRTPGTG